MRQILDLDRFPLDRPDGVRGRELLARCRRELRETGMFSLAELIRPAALERCVAEVEPFFGTAAFTHSREHNIYFDDEIEGVAGGPPRAQPVQDGQTTRYAAIRFQRAWSPGSTSGSR